MTIENLLRAPAHFPDAVIVRAAQCIRLSTDNETGRRTLHVGDVRGPVEAGGVFPAEVRNGRVTEIDLTQRGPLDNDSDDGAIQVFRISSAAALAERVVAHPDVSHRIIEDARLEIGGVGVYAADVWFRTSSIEEQRRFAAKPDDALIEEAAAENIILEDLDEWRESLAQDSTPRRRGGMRP